MTASTPRRVRSPCQSGTGLPPARATARLASVSSSDPGKVTMPILNVNAGLGAGTRACTQATGSARVPERPAFQVGERRAVAPLAPLEQLHDCPAAAPGVQADVVYAGPHDREPAARLGELRHVAGACATAKQAGRTHRRAPQVAA